MAPREPRSSSDPASAADPSEPQTESAASDESSPSVAPEGEQLADRLGVLEAQVEGLGSHLNSLVIRVDAMSEAIHSQLPGLATELEYLTTRLAELNTRLDHLVEDLAEGRSERGDEGDEDSLGMVLSGSTVEIDGQSYRVIGRSSSQGNRVKVQAGATATYLDPNIIPDSVTPPLSTPTAA